MRQRWYAPESQRFISEDPLNTEGGINLYAYMFDNPLSGVDPSGTKDPSRMKPGGDELKIWCNARWKEIQNNFLELVGRVSDILENPQNLKLLKSCPTEKLKLSVEGHIELAMTHLKQYSEAFALFSKYCGNHPGPPGGLSTVPNPANISIPQGQLPQGTRYVLDDYFNKFLLLWATYQAMGRPPGTMGSCSCGGDEVKTVVEVGVISTVAAFIAEYWWVILAAP